MAVSIQLVSGVCCNRPFWLKLQREKQAGLSFSRCHSLLLPMRSLRAVGLQPRPRAALLDALGVEMDDNWSTIALCPESAFWDSLKEWAWKDTDDVSDVRPNAKALGQAGVVPSIRPAACSAHGGP